MKNPLVWSLALSALTACTTPSSLLSVSSEPVGANCAQGGSKIEFGLDDDADGQLDANEIDGTSYACDGEAGVDGTAGVDGSDGANGVDGADAPGALIDVTDEAPGANCAQGGRRFDVGVDDNQDGVLDVGEIDATEYVCNGANVVVDVIAEAPGANCTWGGSRIDTGVDDDGDDVLDAGEIDNSTYVCDGAGGFDTLVTVVGEAAGVNCEFGGQRIDNGVDDDRSGTLDPAEIDGTTYVCNGIQGLGSLMTVTAEAAGANCTYGGQRVEQGVDDDRSGTLEAGEIDETAYVCNASPGFDVATEVGVEPAGANCTYGGQYFSTGIDDDRDGVLDVEETEQTAYVCDGAPGFDSLIAMGSEPDGENCEFGGERIDYGVDDNRDGILDAGEVDGTTFLCSPVATPLGAEVAGSGVIYVDQPLQRFLDGGWTVCLTNTYNVPISTATLTTACTGNFVMLGCTDDDTDPTQLVVAAADTEATVFPALDDGTGNTDHRAVNGVGWYFTDGRSVGFFREGDGVNRSSADTDDGAYPEERLSWHTQGSGGYRCGATKALNSDPTWSRVVLTHD